MLRRKGKRFHGEEEFKKKGIYFKMEKIWAYLNLDGKRWQNLSRNASEKMVGDDISF